MSNSAFELSLPGRPASRRAVRTRPRAARAANPTAVVLWVVGLSPAFSALVSAKRASQLSGLADQYASSLDAPAASWQLLAIDLSVFTAMIAVAGALAFGLARPTGTTPGRGTWLIAAGLGLYAAPILSGLIGGHGGAWNWRLWYAPLAMLALHLAPPVPATELLRHLRGILRVYTWGSLAALLVAPGWAMAPSYIVNFRLPWVGSSRLFGLTDHPILLGVVAVVAVAVEVAPLQRPRLWPLHAAAAAATVLLAQSRTAWITALVALPFLYRRDLPRRVHPLITRGLVAGIALCTAALIPTAEAAAGHVVADPEVTSLHGRTEVWDIAIHVFESNVVWGYGPTLFLDRSSPVHGAYAHAHSQIFQTLATAGLVGAATLALFAAALVVAAVRTGTAGAGLPWALAGITLVTCLTEAPFRGLEPGNPYVLLVLLDVSVLLAFTPRNETAPCSRN